MLFVSSLNYLFNLITDDILANSDAAHELHAAPATPQGSMGVRLFSSELYHFFYRSRKLESSFESR